MATSHIALMCQIRHSPNSPAPALFYRVRFLSDETTPLVTFVALVLIQ